MQTLTTSDIIQELDFLIELNDMSRASRKILDLTKEFDLPPEIELMALQIRVIRK